MISHHFAKLLAFSSLVAVPNVVACSGEESSPSASGGASGSGVTGGTAGSSSGTAGAPAGTGGTTGGTSSGGTSGAATGGSAGSGAGTGGAGTSGAGGAGSGGVAGGGIGGAGTNGGAGGGAAGASGASGAAGAGGSGAFTITTPAFMNMAGCAEDMAGSCATMPVDHTSFGENVSPALTWTGAPAGTQSFAIVFQDLTNGMAHWVIWNIPASVTMLAENIPKMAMPETPAGAQQASYLQNEGYAGPGACGNVYEFVVYALSVPTFSPMMATNQTQVRTQLQALDAQILGTASMRARSMMPEC